MGAARCSPLVVEVQINQEQLYEVSHGDHKLYEVIRATSMNALLGEPELKKNLQTIVIEVAVSQQAAQDFKPFVC